MLERRVMKFWSWVCIIWPFKKGWLWIAKRRVKAGRKWIESWDNSENKEK